jgi:hypothetical protein
MKKNVSAILILVGAVAFSLASCAKGGNTIKIGGIYPLSGNVAVYGVEAKNGVQMAVEEINAAGGIDGKMLELVAEDDEGNPEKTINAYKKLTTKDRAKIIIGSLTSGCTQAFTSLAQAQKVLVVAPAATMASITDAGNFIFRVCFIDPFQVRWARSSPPPTSARSARPFSTTWVTTTPSACSRTLRQGSRPQAGKCRRRVLQHRRQGLQRPADQDQERESRRRLPSRLLRDRRAHRQAAPRAGHQGPDRRRRWVGRDHGERRRRGAERVLFRPLRRRLHRREGHRLRLEVQGEV